MTTLIVQNIEPKDHEAFKKACNKRGLTMSGAIKMFMSGVRNKKFKLKSAVVQAKDEN